MNNHHKISAWTFVVILALLAGSSCKLDPQLKFKDQVIGAKIYNHSGDIDSLIQSWKNIGFNSAFMSPELALKESFCQKVKEAGFNSFIIVPIFYNQEALDLHPEWYAITHQGELAREDWVNFICPSREEYLNQRIAFIKNTIAQARPSGISIDFIRFFVYWEKMDPSFDPTSIPMACFDSLCLMDFQKRENIEVPNQLKTTQAKAGWILRNHSTKWTHWKTRKIKEVVKRIVDAAKAVDPNLQINLHAVPWTQTDYDGAVLRVAGQDLSKLDGDVDYISPMCYSHMLKRDPAWVSNVVRDMAIQARSSKILPSIQVSKAYLDAPLDTAEFRDNLVSALQDPSSGVILWSWESLQKEPSKLQITSRILRDRAIVQ